jgi:hypothetical protein
VLTGRSSPQPHSWSTWVHHQSLFRLKHRPLYTTPLCRPRFHLLCSSRPKWDILHPCCLRRNPNFSSCHLKPGISNPDF